VRGKRWGKQRRLYPIVALGVWCTSALGSEQSYEGAGQTHNHETTGVFAATESMQTKQGVCETEGGVYNNIMAPCPRATQEEKEQSTDEGRGPMTRSQWRSVDDRASQRPRPGKTRQDVGEACGGCLGAEGRRCSTGLVECSQCLWCDTNQGLALVSNPSEECVAVI
jgi:hypothetical protein